MTRPRNLTSSSGFRTPVLSPVLPFAPLVRRNGLILVLWVVKTERRTPDSELLIDVSGFHDFLLPCLSDRIVALGVQTYSG